jgi:hypothetical protein
VLAAATLKVPWSLFVATASTGLSPASSSAGSVMSPPACDRIDEAAREGGQHQKGEGVEVGQHRGGNLAEAARRH